ncbi:hypothetical protein DMC47_35575 [Nostoc sp. 3335mG]|nr:hypothetical protein DMC47_35575 [Nostoc sp. 3335mG]
MATTPADASQPAACPYCREPASGRFCSNCGKQLDEETTARHVFTSVLGAKVPPWKAMLTTARMAMLQPAELTRCWQAGERWGLISPVAMMSTVTAITAAVGVLLSSLFGRHDAHTDDSKNLGAVLQLFSFLRHNYPRQYAQAALDPAAFGDKMKQVASYLAMFWPLLFIGPGYLSLSPWKRISQHHALILACVESIFLLIVSGLYIFLGIASPALAASGIVTTLLWMGTFAHSAWHIRAATGSGWGYAIARPFVAATLYVCLIVIFLAIITALTLATMPILTG